MIDGEYLKTFLKIWGLDPKITILIELIPIRTILSIIAGGYIILKWLKQQGKNMGRFSRAKGRRGEQSLVLYLARYSYKAERILNQAHTAGLADVKATKNGTDYTFELKTYKNAFKTMYDFYYNNRIEEGGVVGVHLGDVGTSGPLVAISTNFENLLGNGTYIFQYPAKTTIRTIKRLLTLKEKKGSADLLVVKDNGKPRLFFKFWE